MECTQGVTILGGESSLVPVSLHPWTECEAGKGMHLTRCPCSLQTSKDTQQTLMRLKIRIPEERKRGVVYEVPCRECSKAYVGETKKTLKVSVR